MAKKTKTFKIGEYAVGGIIEVSIEEITITSARIVIRALDWNTKEIVLTDSAMSDEENVRSTLIESLNEFTSYYHAEKIFDWIKANVDLKSEFGF